jgi:predicted nucleotidyltransferase
VPSRFAESIRVTLDVAERGGFRVALIGGFALPFYGVQRATGDVDFLTEHKGADALHEALLEAGAICLHRSRDTANYDPGESRLSAVDLVYARRPRALAMLERAQPKRVRILRRSVPVVDVEDLIGLKLQAIANEPSRRGLDEADIRALLAARGPELDLDRLRDYYRLFDREAEFGKWIRESRRR